MAAPARLRIQVRPGEETVPYVREDLASGADTKSVRALEFRRERSRPVWRNQHTGTEVVVLNIGTDDRGGFQGGVRRFTVTTDEPPPPGPPSIRAWNGHDYGLEEFLKHWEPTGEVVPIDQVRRP